MLRVSNKTEELRKIHKERVCFWCKKSVMNCDKTCQCVFDQEFNKWRDNHKEIYDFWILKNAKFYEELFDRGMVAENQLAQRWKKYQLAVLEKTKTRIHEWIKDTDYKTTINQYGEEILVRNNADGYKTITPYYEFINSEKLLKYKFHCQLCGQDIKTRFYIKHNKKKLAIGIGGNCGYAFYYSVLVGNNIRNTMNKKINKLFNELIPDIVRKIESELKKEDSSKIPRYWGKEILKRLEKHKKEKPLGPKRSVELILDTQKKGIVSVFQ